MITPLGIKAAQAKAKKTKADVYLADNTNQRVGWRLVLRCMPSGSATWFFRYTYNGNRTQIKLGHLKATDIASARRMASSYADIHNDTPDVRGKLQADAQAERTANEESQAKAIFDKQSRQQRDGYTLAGLMAVYIAYLQSQGKTDSARGVISSSKHLASIAEQPAASVSTRDLVMVQRKLLEAGKGRTANKLRSYVRAAYALVLRAESDATSPAEALDFVMFGKVEANPAALLAVAKGFNRTVDRVLTDKELYLLLEHAKDAGVAGLAVRAAVFLGGQRMSQLLRASSKSIQDDFLVLLDPKGKRDTPRRHPIPLEGIAGTLINEAKNRANTLGTNFLFSSTGKVQLRLDTVSKYVASKAQEFIQSGISITPFTLADLRRTVETRLAGMEVMREVRGYLQSHGLSGVQVRHYERHDYEKEKREALRFLHKWIKSLGDQPKKGV